MIDDWYFFTQFKKQISEVPFIVSKMKLDIFKVKFFGLKSIRLPLAYIIIATCTMYKLVIEMFNCSKLQNIFTQSL